MLKTKTILNLDSNLNAMVFIFHVLPPLTSNYGATLPIKKTILLNVYFLEGQ